MNRVGGDVLAPKVRKRVNPEYGDVARKLRVATFAMFDVYITRTGKVCAVRIVRGSVEPFDRPVLDALKRWEFAPATRNGKAVDCIYTVTVNINVK